MSSSYVNPCLSAVDSHDEYPQVTQADLDRAQFRVGLQPAIGDIFPFRAGATYELPTPYGTTGAAAMLAEAMASYDVTSDGDE